MAKEYDVEAGTKKLATIAAENALGALLKGSRDLAKMGANAIRASHLLGAYKPLLHTLDAYCLNIESILPEESS